MAERPAETPLITEDVSRWALPAPESESTAAFHAQGLADFSLQQGFSVSELHQDKAAEWSRVAYSYIRGQAVNQPLQTKVRTATLPEPLVSKHLQKFWEVKAATGTDNIRLIRLRRAIRHNQALVESAVRADKPFPELKLTLQLYNEAEKVGNQPVSQGLQAVLAAYGMTLTTLGFLQAARTHKRP